MKYLQIINWRNIFLWGGGGIAQGVKPQDACTPHDNITGNHRKVRGDAGM